MEADWEFEIGGDAAVIDAAWSGFVDLRSAPERVTELAEVLAFPPLADALRQLNAPDSPVWTAKCDFWPKLESGAWDPDELDAIPEQALHGAGCYIDLLARTASQWPQPDRVAQSCRALCDRLHAISMASCRADLIIRRAWITPDRTAIGITAYLTACGPVESEAHERLAACLRACLRSLD